MVEVGILGVLGRRSVEVGIGYEWGKNLWGGWDIFVLVEFVIRKCLG